jgi:hypothetical protein
MNLPARQWAVEINVNGILAFPGRSDGWTDRAVTLGHLYLGMREEKFEHFSGVLTRHVWQEKRALALADLVNRYLDRGWPIFLRGHSNGCDVICRALAYLDGAVQGLQLIAAACEADFSANGLNRALLRGVVHRVQLCCSPDDRALWLARISHPFLNLFSNGYGSLGFTGPMNVADEIEHRVSTHWRPGFDHGTWLSSENLLSTMHLLHV